MQREYEVNRAVPARQTCGQLLDWLHAEYHQLALEIVVAEFDSNFFDLPCAFDLALFDLADLMRYAAQYDNDVQLARRAAADHSRKLELKRSRIRRKK